MVQKKIIIIGASSGIGREIAIKYVAMGWMVGITGRREKLLVELKNSYPGQIQVSAFDVGSENSRERLLELIETMGGMDVFLYNSGYGDTSRSLDWDIERETTRV